MVEEMDEKEMGRHDQVYIRPACWTVHILHFVDKQ